MKINLTDKQIAKLKNSVLKEGQKYKNKIFTENSRSLSAVLKGHLVIEGLIDDLIDLNNSSSKNIKKKNFFTKIQILKFCYIVNEKLFKRLIAINVIRNKYAHDLNYVLTLEDVRPLIEGHKIKDTHILAKLTYGIASVIGYMQATKAFYKNYPFVFEILFKGEKFQSDKVYRAAKKTIKPFLKELDIEKWKL